LQEPFTVISWKYNVIINVQDGNTLRTKFLVELLNYEKNECNKNIPIFIQEFLKHIMTAQMVPRDINFMCIYVNA
jgi:hypothetical protein